MDTVTYIKVVFTSQADQKTPFSDAQMVKLNKNFKKIRKCAFPVEICLTAKL